MEKTKKKKILHTIAIQNGYNSKLLITKKTELIKQN